MSLAAEMPRLPPFKPLKQKPPKIEVTRKADGTVVAVDVRHRALLHRAQGIYERILALRENESGEEYCHATG